MQISKRNGWQMNLHSFQLSIHSSGVYTFMPTSTGKRKKNGLLDDNNSLPLCELDLFFQVRTEKPAHFSLVWWLFCYRDKKSSEHTKKRAIYNLKQMCSLSGNRLSRRSLSIMARRMFHCQRPKMAKKCWFSSSHYSLAQMTKCNLNDRHFAIKK